MFLRKKYTFAMCTLSGCLDQNPLPIHFYAVCLSTHVVCKSSHCGFSFNKCFFYWKD